MSTKKNLKLEKLAFGGVAIGTGFNKIDDKQAGQALESAWESGIRQYDTSPWYGLGLSERRMGHFLKNKKREDYILSTKVGRLFTPTNNIPETQWVDPSPFDYRYDYTADGVRRSVEDSLQRLGVESINYAFIHDLSPDNNADLGDWEEHFEIAKKGAMPELTKMREEGLIKGWGLGVNTVEPIIRTIDYADPDLFVSAIQYSMIDHKDSLDRLFPKVEESGVGLIVAAPFNAGLLSGQKRYNYAGEMPEDVDSRYKKMIKIADKYDVDLAKAAIQFSYAPKVVDTVLAGASKPYQNVENVKAFDVKIPKDFWVELKNEGLIDERCETPQF
ncbi:aldo/keto reductase [Zunongwangia sp. SCSIO 43204]|uniref:aldo/keto reductase n=1 Tax=Zunongwangia sp. SCSIO 43204 TaxID=2779359 RepID=UPI001CA868BF|nr:aldo/keto reductase [Zunongwangia sp. SCSIO 43204]UAB83703.1 aldo/keto reductase [Zunongwangia sp. SCSIO 43204]